MYAHAQAEDERYTPLGGRFPGWRRWSHVLTALGVGAGSAFVLELIWVLAGANYHQVMPGQIYRGAQLGVAELMAVVQRDQIRTVVNLRGCCEDAEWYNEQTRILNELGVRQIDANFSSYSLPSAPELHKLIRGLHGCEYPVLIHCRRGADRTGLAAGLALLLHSNVPFEKARQQLSFRFGHAGVDRASALSGLIDQYEDWLREQGRTHDRDVLLHWALEEYRPGHCWAEITPVDVPDRLPFGRPVAARFRVTNRSRLPWHFRRAANAGVHLHYSVVSREALAIRSRDGGAGFFDQTLQPGESLELTLSLPAIRVPGRYLLRVDMFDARLASFHMFGSPPFEREVEVVAP